MIDAAPGVITELGDIELAREIRIQGRVRAGEDKSRESLSIGIVRSDSSIDWLPVEAVQCDTDGHFELIGLGPRIYALRTRNHDQIAVSGAVPNPWVSGIELIDLRAAIPPSLEIQLKPATLLALSMPDASAAGLRYSVVDSRGFELTRSTFYEVQPRRLMLPQDRYRILVFDPTGKKVVERSAAIGDEPMLLDLER